MRQIRDVSQPQATGNGRKRDKIYEEEKLAILLRTQRENVSRLADELGVRRQLYMRGVMDQVFAEFSGYLRLRQGRLA
ncbi:hypothetical protein [Mesorhizobium sp. M0522]|uniref:hypothetical protein n=1 Tax=Mesorhizobium sp. M0522 TaxID=2956958 RepID=UPI00333AEFC2